MSKTHSRIKASLVGFLISSALLGASSACALEPDDDNPPPPTQGLFSDHDFEQCVAGPAKTLNQWYDLFEQRLSQKIEQLDQDCHLNPQQKSKLRLAGEGDLKRLRDRVEMGRSYLRAAQNDRFRFTALRERLIMHQYGMHEDLFGSNSLFSKTLPVTLTLDQGIEHVRSATKRWFEENGARVQLYIDTEINALDLTHLQKQQFLSLIEKQGVAAGSSLSPAILVMNLLANLPENELRRFLNDEQWKTYAQHRESYRRKVKFSLKDQTAFFSLDWFKIP